VVKKSIRKSNELILMSNRKKSIRSDDEAIEVPNYVETIEIFDSDRPQREWCTQKRFQCYGDKADPESGLCKNCIKQIVLDEKAIVNQQVKEAQARKMLYKAEMEMQSKMQKVKRIELELNLLKSVQPPPRPSPKDRPRDRTPEAPRKRGDIRAALLASSERSVFVKEKGKKDLPQIVIDVSSGPVNGFTELSSTKSQSSSLAAELTPISEEEMTIKSPMIWSTSNSNEFITQKNEKITLNSLTKLPYYPGKSIDKNTGLIYHVITPDSVMYPMKPIDKVIQNIGMQHVDSFSKKSPDVPMELEDIVKEVTDYQKDGIE
jgi:hypothetical protein